MALSEVHEQCIQDTGIHAVRMVAASDWGSVTGYADLRSASRCQIQAHCWLALFCSGHLQGQRHGMCMLLHAAFAALKPSAAATLLCAPVGASEGEPVCVVYMRSHPSNQTEFSGG